jgi:hypothetical protein
MEYLSAFNRLIAQPNALTRNREAIVENGLAFSKEYEDPNKIAGDPTIPEDMRPLFNLLRTASLPVDIEILTARMIKILLRKMANRMSIGAFGMSSILSALHRQASGANRNAAASEIGSMVLNTCYDGANVLEFLEGGGVPLLVNMLRSRDPGIQVSVLGALQGVCFVPSGRQIVRQDADVIATIFFFLKLLILLITLTITSK